MSHDFDHSTGNSSKPSEEHSAATANTAEEEPIFVARYSRLNENGKMREYVRTRSGREIPVLNENDAEWFEKNCPYDPDL